MGASELRIVTVKIRDGLFPRWKGHIEYRLNDGEWEHAYPIRKGYVGELPVYEVPGERNARSEVKLIERLQREWRELRQPPKQPIKNIYPFSVELRP